MAVWRMACKNTSFVCLPETSPRISRSYFHDMTSLIRGHYKTFEKLFFVSLVVSNTYVTEKMLVIVID